MAFHTAQTRVPLHGPAHATNRRTQGPHSAAQTPSTEVVRLGFVKRLWLCAFYGLGTWLGFCGPWYGQLFWFGALFAPHLVHDFAHQHSAHLLAWGDAKSPARNNKYFPAKNCTTRFFGRKPNFEQVIMLTSCLVHAIQLRPVGQSLRHIRLSADQTSQPRRDDFRWSSRAFARRNTPACAHTRRGFPHWARYGGGVGFGYSPRYAPAKHDKTLGYLLRLLN